MFSVPVTTYVFGPSDETHVKYYCEEGSEIVPNVVYMGMFASFFVNEDLLLFNYYLVLKYSRGNW